MVEQGKVVAGVSFPSVGRADRRARASGVALVHRDYAEILGQLSGWVEGAAAPEIDAGAQPARREQQQRVTRPIFLVVQRYARALKNRHQSTPPPIRLQNTMVNRRCATCPSIRAT